MVLGASMESKDFCWLPWLITSERDEATRTRALDFSTQIGFPIHGRAGGKAAYAALQDQSVAVRLGALKYLAKHGPLSAISEIRPLLTHADDHVKESARSTIHAIHMRSNPNKEMRQVVKGAIPLTQTLIDAVNENLARFNVVTLEMCLNHSSPVLRARGAEELQRRGNLSLPAALQLVTDDSRLVRENAFCALTDHAAAPTPTEIRRQLSSHPLFPSSVTRETANPDRAVTYYFSKQPADKLWSFVDLLDENSHLALRALSERFFATNGQIIRDALADDFEQRTREAKARRDQQSPRIPSYFTVFGEDPIETERRNLRTAALEGLADNPSDEDRSLFKRFLSSELSAVDQTIACLRGLSRAGVAADLPSVAPFLTSPSSSVKAAAARCCLELAKDLTAILKELIASKSEPILWIVVATTLKRRGRQTWEHLKPLLSDENDEIRRLACLYATSVLLRKELLSELNTCLKSGWYYYNVVTLFDRALYAPASARAHFKHEEQLHFEKLSNEATRNWPGLTL